MKLGWVKQWLQAEGFAGVPRWYFLMALPIFYAAVLIAAYWKWDASLPIAVNLENVAALSGGGLFPWLLAFTHLHVEALHMIFSMSINRREAQRAAEAAEAAEQERSAAEQERSAVERERSAVERERSAAERERSAAERERSAAERERSELRAWFQRNEARLPKDLELPPGIDRNGTGNGAE